jgi:hypothetical protein
LNMATECKAWCGTTDLNSIPTEDAVAWWYGVAASYVCSPACARRGESTTDGGTGTMMEIELRTDQGHFVAVVEIPPFPDSGLPEVVVWGTRTFLLARDAEPPTARVVYEEGFAVMSLTPSPGLPRN